MQIRYIPYYLTADEQIAYDVLLEVYKRSVNTFSERHSLNALCCIALSASQRPKTITHILDAEEKAAIVYQGIEDRTTLEEYFNKVGLHTYNLCIPLSPKDKAKVYAAMQNSEAPTCLVDVSQLPLNPPFTQTLPYILPANLLTPDLNCIPNTATIYVPLAVPTNNVPSLDCAYGKRHLDLLAGYNKELVNYLTADVTTEMLELQYTLPPCQEIPSTAM